MRYACLRPGCIVVVGDCVGDTVGSDAVGNSVGDSDGEVVGEVVGEHVIAQHSAAHVLLKSLTPQQRAWGFALTVSQTA